MTKIHRRRAKRESEMQETHAKEIYGHDGEAYKARVIDDKSLYDYSDDSAIKEGKKSSSRAKSSGVKDKTIKAELEGNLKAIIKTGGDEQEDIDKLRKNFYLSFYLNLLSNFSSYEVIRYFNLKIHGETECKKIPDSKWHTLQEYSSNSFSNWLHSSLVFALAFIRDDCETYKKATKFINIDTGVSTVATFASAVHCSFIPAKNIMVFISGNVGSLVLLYHALFC